MFEQGRAWGAAHTPGMSTFDETLHPRAAGGQFTTVTRTEPDVALDAISPVPLADEFDGQEVLTLSDFELGSTLVQSVDVVQPTEPGGRFRVDMTRYEAISRSMLEQNPDIGAGLEDGDERIEAAERYLDERETLVRDFFAARYPGTAIYTDDDWGSARMTVSDELDPNASTEDLGDLVHRRMAQIHNETDPGTYGAENVWRLLDEHLRQADEHAADVARGSGCAGFMAEGHGPMVETRPDGRPWQWEDLTPASRDLIAGDVRDLLHEQAGPLSEWAEHLRTESDYRVSYPEDMLARMLMSERQGLGINFSESSAPQSVKAWARRLRPLDVATEIHSDGSFHLRAVPGTPQGCTCGSSTSSRHLGLCPVIR